MKIHDCVQGSKEWAQLRCGVPTASQFFRIVTPGGKKSAQQDGYLFDLLAERILGKPLVQFTSHWMDRGHSLEAEAVSFYEFTRDCKTEKVGFITNDAGRIGASPDRLIGDDGLLQIKVPSPGTHIQYLLTEKIEREYFPQLMGELWISERKYNEILSYHPELPPAIARLERDEPFITFLSSAVTEFSTRLEELWLLAHQRGWVKERPAVEPGGPKIQPLPPLNELLRMMKESLVETKA